MQFTSFDFLVFFPVVVLLFYVMPRRLRQLWLLLASYYFYMGWNAKYALLILASTIITYLGGILMNRAGVQKDGSRRKCRWILAAGIVGNLAFLVFFKYFYFLHDTFAALLGVFGVQAGASRLDILLPVGIS
ncbi:MAG: MBOAT family protein, partial [Lachnospiraceae bacterium]|nr:MBOAT family protein [Lachnospiraceae bacterium]